MRIVYAEDDASVRAIFTTLLVSHGVHVHEAHDGGEAIALCRAFQPATVLLDLEMPNIDGYECARRIRESAGSAAPRLVALTGDSSAEARRRAELAGFDELLVKPVSARQLIEAIGMSQ